MWQVIGNDSTSHKDYRPGLVRHDLETGRVLEIVELLPGSSDPHGLAVYNGKLISCDAGMHPGWPNNDSPHGRLDLPDRFRLSGKCHFVFVLNSRPPITPGRIIGAETHSIIPILARSALAKSEKH